MEWLGEVILSKEHPVPPMEGVRGGRRSLVLFLGEVDEDMTVGVENLGLGHKT